MTLLYQIHGSVVALPRHQEYPAPKQFIQWMSKAQVGQPNTAQKQWHALGLLDLDDHIVDPKLLPVSGPPLESFNRRLKTLCSIKRRLIDVLGLGQVKSQHIPRADGRTRPSKAVVS